MNKLILFAGLPAVGKTTLSRVVGERVGAEIIDIDDFKRIHIDPALVKTQIDPPELRWKCYRDAVTHAFSLFDQGTQAAILDEVFHLHSLRTQVESLCKERGVQVLWVEVQCPYDTVAERLNTKSRAGHILSTDEALRMHLLFQEIFEAFPLDSGNHIIIRNEGVGDVNSMADEVLRKVA